MHLPTSLCTFLDVFLETSLAKLGWLATFDVSIFSLAKKRSCLLEASHAKRSA